MHDTTFASNNGDPVDASHFLPGVILVSTCRYVKSRRKSQTFLLEATSPTQRALAN
jgi:hypothetical protein